MMNKNITSLFLIVLFTGSLSGQTTADYIMKAKAFNDAGKPDEAITLLSDAIAVRKESRLYIERAEAEVLKGDYSEAVADYNASNEILPFSGEYGLSRIYSLKGDAATSMYHLERSLGSSSRKTEQEIMLDPAFGRIENSQEWRQLWKKEWYSKSEKAVSEIEYYTSAGKIEESKEVLKDLKTTYELNDAIRYAEALISLASGNSSDAVRIASDLIQANPESEKYLRLLARGQSSSSNPSGASATYTRMLELGVADAQLYILRAECYRKTGETDKALADIEKYLSLYAGNKEALSLAGKTETASGDNLKALEYFSENLRLHPGDPECYIDRANSFFMAKSWDWAEKDYSMSLDLNPGNADIWLNKGIALLNSGRTEDACHDFRKALNLGSRKASEFIGRNCIR